MHFIFILINSHTTKDIFAIQLQTVSIRRYIPMMFNCCFSTTYYIAPRMYSKMRSIIFSNICTIIIDIVIHILLSLLLVIDVVTEVVLIQNKIIQRATNVSVFFDWYSHTCCKENGHIRHFQQFIVLLVISLYKIDSLILCLRWMALFKKTPIMTFLLCT